MRDGLSALGMAWSDESWPHLLTQQCELLGALLDPDASPSIAPPSAWRRAWTSHRGGSPRGARSSRPPPPPLVRRGYDEEWEPPKCSLQHGGASAQQIEDA